MTAIELLDLGEKYLLEMNYEEAILCFDRLIEIEPRNVRGYMGLAEIYVGLGNSDKAVEVLQSGMQQISNDVEISAMLNELTKGTSEQDSVTGLTPAPSLPLYTASPVPPSTEPTATPIPPVFDAEKAFEAFAQFLYNIGKDDWSGGVYAKLDDFDHDGEPEMLCVKTGGGFAPLGQLYLADYSHGVLKTIYINEAVADGITVYAASEYSTEILTDGQVGGRIVIRSEGSDIDFYGHPSIGRTLDYVEYEQILWLELLTDEQGDFSVVPVLTEIILVDCNDGEWKKEYYLVGDRLCAKDEYTQKKDAYLSELTQECIFWDEPGIWYEIDNGPLDTSASELAAQLSLLWVH
jgi:tetratricopeptide (TPR) repeat protein